MAISVLSLSAGALMLPNPIEIRLSILGSPSIGIGNGRTLDYPRWNYPRCYHVLPAFVI